MAFYSRERTWSGQGVKNQNIIRDNPIEFPIKRHVMKIRQFAFMNRVEQIKKYQVKPKRIQSQRSIKILIWFKWDHSLFSSHLLCDAFEFAANSPGWLDAMYVFTSYDWIHSRVKYRFNELFSCEVFLWNKSDTETCTEIKYIPSMSYEGGLYFWIMNGILTINDLDQLTDRNNSEQGLNAISF